MFARPKESVGDLLDRLRDEEFERIVDERVAQRARSDALRWRFRLITVETLAMGGLVLAAGLFLGKPTLDVMRAALWVAAACFASGMLLIGLSGFGSACCRQLRDWITRP